jgi:hypothetical protein
MGCAKFKIIKRKPQLVDIVKEKKGTPAALQGGCLKK